MGKEKIIKYLKIVITCIIVLLFVWFLFVNPYLSFKKNERTLLNAAKRYFVVNSNELPTGNRIKTVTLQTLYHKSYIEGDLNMPYSSNTCTIEDSWVKVRKENGEYKYYTYLKCGVLTSKVDHEGPVVKLNGDDVITLNKGDKYTEAGVKSVNDKTDGTLNTSDVVIDSSKVNTNKAGTYNVTYTISDSFNNKTVKIRKVKVLSILNTTVKKDSINGIYQGSSVNNYIMFSNMLFRIVGVDSDNNVKIVSNETISYVNHDGIDKWLDYFYEHLMDSSKKFIVNSKYCNDTLDANNINKTDCSSYTSKKKAYILSMEDINKSLSTDGSSYLYPFNFSWTATGSNKNESYAVSRTFSNNDNKNYMSLSNDYNIGVNPAITIKGDSKIISGDGTSSSPYKLGDTNKAKVGEKINTRYSGEYLSYGGVVYRIMDVDSKDGTTHVIMNNNLKYGNSSIKTKYMSGDTIYNPTVNGNLGYFINNSSTQYFKTNYFVNKKVDVSIYKDKASYGNALSTKQYRVKFAAPSIYDMFSATSSGFWMRDSSKNSSITFIVSQTGVLYFDEIAANDNTGVRLEGYIDKDCTIKSGNGTIDNPYVIVK